LKFDVRLKYISGILLFQITCYLEIWSNNQLICLKSDGQFTVQRVGVNFQLRRFDAAVRADTLWHC